VSGYSEFFSPATNISFPSTTFPNEGSGGFSSLANKSNNTGQVISIPQIVGALHGIGEKFAPDLHTETGNFTVPITLPPGRNGFQPQINLVYSTGAGNGPFSLGGGLSVLGVSRKTSRWIPPYGDERGPLAERDTLLLSGAEDLVPVSDKRMEAN